MEEFKDWRVDVFHTGKHNKYYFDTEAEALTFALEQSLDSNVYILCLFTTSVYDVVKEVSSRSRKKYRLPCQNSIYTQEIKEIRERLADMEEVRK